MGEWALGYVPPKFEIFLILPYFLRSQVLSCSANREATRIPILRYYISPFVLLWLIESALKHCKVPKYYDQDCLKGKKLTRPYFWEKIHFGDKHLKAPQKQGFFGFCEKKNSSLMYIRFGFKSCTITTFMILPKPHIWQKSGSRIKCKNALSQSDCKAFKV